MHVLIDGALTHSFDQAGPRLIGLAWLTGLAATAAVLVRPPGPAPKSADGRSQRIDASRTKDVPHQTQGPSTHTLPRYPGRG